MSNSELKENTVYIVNKGKLEPVDKPKTGFGKTVINWQDNKVVSMEISYTVR